MPDFEPDQPTYALTLERIEPSGTREGRTVHIAADSVDAKDQSSLQLLGALAWQLLMSFEFDACETEPTSTVGPRADGDDVAGTRPA